MDYNEFNKKLLESFKKYIDISINDSQVKMFYDYMNILVEKNKVVNLTAITDYDEIILKHFVDSSILNKYINIDGKVVLDVGTGAGFPGLPLAIINNNTKFILSDTLGKRIEFLKEVIKIINIDNIELIKARAEDLANNKMYRENVDIVVSRGVAKLSVLSEYSLPFVKINGQMIAWKMNDIDNELKEANKAINELGGMFHVKHTYRLLENEPDRCLLVINKEKNTPNKFPRKAGTPSKTPL